MEKLEFNYNRLKGERIAKGFTIQDMANALEITSAAYSRKENGKRAITIEELAQISNKLGIDDLNIFFILQVS